MPVKTSIQVSLKIPGFRVALAIASLPGMTVNYGANFDPTTVDISDLL
jgi:hypothetical protein